MSKTQIQSWCGVDGCTHCASNEDDNQIPEIEQEEAYYDYDLQCYVVDGIVVKCGHIETLQGCYSCTHAGEKVQK